MIESEADPSGTHMSPGPQAPRTGLGRGGGEGSEISHGSHTHNEAGSGY